MLNFKTDDQAETPLPKFSELRFKLSRMYCLKIRLKYLVLNCIKYEIFETNF